MPVTLFDTLGVTTRETVISKVLAYYLDENEAHGLGRVFLDSLLCSMRLQADGFPSPYTIERERHNIDILIRGEGNTWAVILENKIYHSCINPFDEYLSRVDARCKQGVLVTLWPTGKNTPKDYVNVTHNDWLACVRRSVVPNEQWPDDERQRLLYTDFMANMKTLTNALTNDSRNNEAIRLFQEHEAVGKINNLLRKQRELERYIQAHINAVFAIYGFKEGDKRFYYPGGEQSESQSAPPFRFFVEDKILTNKQLCIYFELHGDATEVGPDIRDSLNRFHNLAGLRFDDNKTVQGVYYHLAHTIESALMPSDDFPAMLNKIIGRFFVPGDSIVEHCNEYWLKKQQNKYD